MNTIFDYGLADWEAWTKSKGVPKYRAAQIYSFCSKGVQDLDRMQNLPLDLRKAIREDFVLPVLTLQQEFRSENDGTRKFVFRLHDGHIIETVAMWYKTGVSVCISSQSGCRMGCSFCASAAAGFGRNLTPGEMLGQITVVSDLIGERIRSVVVMGIGEPFDNYDNLIAFLHMANAPEGLNLGARHITVSTCGLVPQMLEFMHVNLQVNLSVSLHAPDDRLRAELMPAARIYTLKELIDACRRYTEETGRRITFEYSLFSGVNDNPEQARALYSLLRGVHCHVNLIAANEFPGSAYHRSSSERVRSFQEILEKLGMNVTLRREMGSDIQAACGQLRRGIQERETI